MKVLVHPHTMEMGGSQLNAIELADAVHRHGHDVAVYAPPGVLVEEVRRRGLTWVEAPAPGGRAPSWDSALRLLRFVRNEGFDIIHAYEWDATLDTVFGPGLLGTPVLSTVLSMGVPRYLPSTVPLIVGTKELLERESSWRPEVFLMEPPIDLDRNRPGAAPNVLDAEGTPSIRERWSIPADDRLIVLVGRLSHGLKLGGVLEAVRAIPLLSEKAHLLIVGDGPARPQVAELATRINAGAPRPLITVTGLMTDPRAAYDAADVVLGMGGSILRAMAFGKPVIVQGEHGFWKTLDTDSLTLFRHQGWYGVGDGSDGAPLLAWLLHEIFHNPEEASRHGELGRRVVAEHYSLQRSGEDLLEIYKRLSEHPVPLGRRLHRCASASYRLTRTRIGRARRHAGRRVRAMIPGPPREVHAPPAVHSWS